MSDSVREAIAARQAAKADANKPKTRGRSKPKAEKPPQEGDASTG